RGCYEGWNGRRAGGWEALTDEDVRDFAPLQDGLLLISSNSVYAVNAHGSWNPIGPGDNPAAVSRACHHEDGQIDLACNGRIERASIERLEPLPHPPSGVTSITALAHAPAR